MFVASSIQPQFHLYSGNSSKIARNSHPRGTPKLGGQAVKRDANRGTLSFGVIFDSRPCVNVSNPPSLLLVTKKRIDWILIYDLLTLICNATFTGEK
jgi:hypothetical protein